MKRILSLSVLATLAASVLFVGCQPRSDIKIGAPLPLTGDGAAYGEAAKNAIELAVGEVNASGGIAGRKVKVIYEDTKLEAAMALAAFNKLVTVDKVPVVIGPLASHEVEAILPRADEMKVVVVAPAATDHKLSGRSPWFVRTIANDLYEGDLMAQFAYDQLGVRKLAIFSVQAAGPKGVSDALSSRFVALGGKVVATEYCDQGATDMRSQLSKIKASGADALFLAGFADETGRMLVQAKELGVKMRMLAHQTAEAPEVRKTAGSAADGLIFASAQPDPKASSAVAAFFQHYHDKYGQDPQNYAANAYDAANIVLAAIKSKGTSAIGIRDSLHAIKDYDGASGTFSITANGDAEGAMFLKTIRNGEVVLYAPEAAK